MKTRILTAGVLVLMLLFTSSILAASEADQLLLNGIEQYYHQDYDQSIVTFDQVLADNPSSVDALYYQTLCLTALDKVAPARANIEQLQQLGYDFGIIHWKLGTVYLNEDGQFDSPFYNEARKQLEKANELGIDSPAFHSDLAMAYHGLNDVDKAIGEYRKALQGGKDIGDYINLAALYKQAGQTAEAVNTYSKALELAPDNSSIYLNMGEIYLQQKKFKAAVSILQQGVDRFPDYNALRNKLAMALYQNGDFKQAEAQFNRVIEHNDNFYQAYYYLGEINSRIEGNTQQAVYYYNQALRENPDYVNAYLALGNIYLEQDNIYKAIAQFTTAIEKNMNYPDSHYYLALAYHKLNMNEAAIAELRKTLHLDNNYQAASDLLQQINGE